MWRRPEDEPMIAHLLDLTNVWLDKYKNNDADNQYHQQLDEQNKMLRNSMKNKKGKKTNEKEEKNKSKAVFEIFEEVIERTEITYHIFKKDNDDTHMKEQMKN